MRISPESVEPLALAVRWSAILAAWSSIAPGETTILLYFLAGGGGAEATAKAAVTSPSLGNLGEDDEDEEEAVLQGEGLECCRCACCRGRGGGVTEAPVSEESDNLGRGGFRATSPLSWLVLLTPPPPVVTLRRSGGPGW